MTTEYVMYKGEDLLHIGTVEEIAKARGVKVDSIKYYRTPTYKKRVERRKNARNYITLTELGD